MFFYGNILKEQANDITNNITNSYKNHILSSKNFTTKKILKLKP